MINNGSSEGGNNSDVKIKIPESAADSQFLSVL